MLTLFLAAQSRRAASTAIIIRASHPATEPVHGHTTNMLYMLFALLAVVTINMLFQCGQFEQEVIGYRAGLSAR